MSQQELLKKVTQTLANAGIEYMLSGSLVSSIQGEPRLTHDIDLVVAIHHNAVVNLTQAFAPPDYFLSEESIYEAIDSKGMFNLIDVTTGNKADFWILTDEPFDQSRFSRKYVEEIMGMQIVVSAPEDTILAKLNWAKLSGGSEKQFTDALRIYEVQYDTLDMDYLHLWAGKLGVKQLFNRLLNEAESI